MNILIIDDSKTISHILITSLSAYGYSTHLVPPSEFRAYKRDLVKYSLVIINTNLTDKKCTEVVQEIRDCHREVFILGIHNRGHWKDRVDLLQAGADDVLNYPFPMQELTTRIQVLLRRKIGKYKSKFKVQNITVDPMKRKVYKDKQEIALKRKEFNLLEYMVRNKNRAVSRSELMDQVWDYKRITGSNTVDVHINRLRKIVGDNNMIQTVHGFGYKLFDKATESTYEKQNVQNDINMPLPTLE